MSINFIESRRKGKLLIYDNYIFRLDKKRRSREYWKCRVLGCSARITLEKETLTSDSKHAKHNHDAEENEIVAKTFKQQVKKDIRQNPLKTVPEIYNEAKERILNSSTGSLQSEVEGKMPSLNSVRTSLYRERRQGFPYEPKNRSDLIIDGIWSKTLDERSFLLTSDGTDDKILVFGTVEFLRKLCWSQTVFLDGSIKSIPKLFSQIYVIYCIDIEKFYPSLFVFLPDKNVETYTRLFEVIKKVADDNGADFNPRIFHVDFEVGMMTALTKTFPHAKIDGCLFHFTRCIWRKVIELELATEFQNSEETKTLVKRIASLPIVPETAVNKAWFKILTVGSSALKGKVNGLVEYVFKHWISENSSFEKSVWCHFNNDDLRSNYHMEECYYRLSRRLCRKPHPSVYEMIGAMQQQQQDNDTDIMMSQNDPPIPQNKKRYRNSHRKLLSLREIFINNEIELLDLLDHCGDLAQLQE